VAVRTPFRTNLRAAAVTMLEAYAADATIKLQVYRARPRSVLPPCAFLDRVSETIEYFGPQIRQRTPQAEVVVLHGLFDSGDAVDQADAFADGFLEWVTDNVHAAGANTTVGAVSIEDEPTYVTDWMAPENQRAYYATRITLEGFAGD
jgi:hypothetical protein